MMKFFSHIGNLKNNQFFPLCSERRSQLIVPTARCLVLYTGEKCYELIQLLTKLPTENDKNYRVIRWEEDTLSFSVRLQLNESIGTMLSKA